MDSKKNAKQGNFRGNFKGNNQRKDNFKGSNNPKKPEQVSELPSSDSNIKIYELNEIIPSKYKTIDEFKKKIHEKCIKDSIANVKKHITEEDLLSIYVSYLDIMDEIINSYFERVSEHFTIYYPEASIKASVLLDFLKIKSITRKELSKMFSVSEDSMGLDLKKQDLEILSHAIESLRSLTMQKDVFESRVKEMAIEIAPNTSALAGEVVCARLIAAAGGLKRLMLMPSSTIQVIGAEKALFRHLRGKAKPPKHGIIFNTAYVSSAALNHRGKIARALASKIAISAKIDYYKGGSISAKLINDLEKKIGGLKK